MGVLDDLKTAKHLNEKLDRILDLFSDFTKMKNDLYEALEIQRKMLKVLENIDKKLDKIIKNMPK